METQNKRTRMNINSNAKGLIQFDITCEYETPEESAKQLFIAIDQLREVVKQKDLKLVEHVES